jgi:hypothetical protein
MDEVCSNQLADKEGVCNIGKDGWDNYMLNQYNAGSIPCPTSQYQYMIGSMVFISAGTGMGQYRFLSQATNLSDGTFAADIDYPWDVAPDNSSWIGITKMKGHVLAVGNNFACEGGHAMAWMNSAPIIYADNIIGAPFFNDPSNGTMIQVYGSPNSPTTLSYNSAFRFWNNGSYPDTISGMYPGSLSPSWYPLVLNNTIPERSTGFLLFSVFGGYPSSKVNFTMAWGLKSSIGTVWKNNINKNGSNVFNISLGSFAGACLVEGNMNVSQLAYDSSSFYGWHSDTYIVFRNNQPSAIKGLMYACGHDLAAKCGFGKFSNNTAVDCFQTCKDTLQIIT